MFFWARGRVGFEGKKSESRFPLHSKDQLVEVPGPFFAKTKLPFLKTFPIRKRIWVLRLARSKEYGRGQQGIPLWFSVKSPFGQCFLMRTAPLKELNRLSVKSSWEQKVSEF